MQIAVRYEDGSKNLLSYAPSDEFSTEQIVEGTREFMERSAGKKIATVLLQVSETAVVGEQTA